MSWASFLSFRLKMCLNNQPNGVTEGLSNKPEKVVTHVLQELEGRGYEKFSWGGVCPQTTRTSCRKWPSPNSNTGSAPGHGLVFLMITQFLQSVWASEHLWLVKTSDTAPGIPFTRTSKNSHDIRNAFTESMVDNLNRVSFNLLQLCWKTLAIMFYTLDLKETFHFIL